MRMNPRTIVLVEDDLADIELTRVALSEVNVAHEFEAISDGREALARLQRTGPYEKHSVPGLVLLDLNLPHMLGLDLLRQLKEHPDTRPIPVVVFSGSEDPRVIADVYARHANAFIHKPADVTSFALALRMSAEYWLGQVVQVGSV